MDEPLAYRALVEELLRDPEVSETQMMGMPALKLAGKLFGGRQGAELTLKIGRERAAELLAAGRARPFDPSGRGRPMKDWVLLGEPSADWSELAGEALRFVRSA
ncbi:MAG TPA: hypothetical protein VL977_03395 [Solirubrobacteraceae bacterium]|nr:hypothetical protein [Solirubrobacteraceae bacterium]